MLHVTKTSRLGGRVIHFFLPFRQTHLSVWQSWDMPFATPFRALASTRWARSSRWQSQVQMGGGAHEVCRAPAEALASPTARFSDSKRVVQHTDQPRTGCGFLVYLLWLWAGCSQWWSCQPNLIVLIWFSGTILLNYNYTIFYSVLLTFPLHFLDTAHKSWKSVTDHRVISNISLSQQHQHSDD